MLFPKINYVVYTSLNASNPTGTVIEVDTATTPTNYLRANGTQVSKTTYAALFAVIGERYATITMPSIIGQPWRQQYSFNKANSTISAWVANTPLPISISSSHVIVTNNRVYLLGGWLNNTTSTVYTAPINPNGTLGAWVTSTPLPIALWGAQAIVTNNRVYLLGGIINGVYSSAVYTAPINPDGTLGSWVIDTPLPGTITNSQAIITNNRVYLLGGIINGVFSSAVYTAPINPDGTLGTWVTDTPLPGVIVYSQAIVTNNRVYLLGGVTNNGVFSSTVYTASINIDGTLSTWTINAPLPVTISHSQAIVTNNRVYLLGGSNNSGHSSAVYTAPINPDGTIGTWVIDTPLPVTIINSQAIVTNNRVYLLGGTINSYSSTTVYTAPINPDGTLGAWVTNTPLPGMPIYPQVILTNSRIYIFTVFPEMYSAPFSGGLNNYINLTSINATTFTLPDYTIIDTASSPKSYHYIKF